jgi:hypothetical protein
MKTAILFLSVLVLSCSVCAEQKGKKETGKVVDAGSFGIFVNGKRIGTETFHIEQRADLSIANSQIKVDDGTQKADQSSEMQITPKGELRLYTWKSVGAAKEESVVEPKDEFLVQHLTPADQKKQDIPYILPLATVILDDNFFSHREILVWRYLATGCLRKDEHLECGPSHFGILVPRQHTSGSAVMELVGMEKTRIKGLDVELNKIKLDSDGVLWVLWVDDQYKVIKMAVPANNVEIIRDPEAQPAQRAHP